MPLWGSEVNVTVPIQGLHGIKGILVSFSYLHLDLMVKKSIVINNLVSYDQSLKGTCLSRSYQQYFYFYHSYTYFLYYIRMVAVVCFTMKQ